MADTKKIEKEVKEVISKEREKLEGIYAELIEKLNGERERLSSDLQREYKNARKYVSSHPETGIGAAFAGGLLAGIIITKILSR